MQGGDSQWQRAVAASCDRQWQPAATNETGDVKRWWLSIANGGRRSRWQRQTVVDGVAVSDSQWWPMVANDSNRQRQWGWRQQMVADDSRRWLTRSMENDLIGVK